MDPCLLIRIGYEYEAFAPGKNFESSFQNVRLHHLISSATMTHKLLITLKATIIDVVKKDRLVDLSLKLELVNIYMEDIDSQTPKKARKPSTAKDTSASSDAKSVSTVV
ncbi:hypothetical protein Tco_0749901 [Tanacetum coccineum]|uniref:Uncharacterized protein n=1 Tax=Tanacetum coccineum TaxID=301880 RepID=A0ABQ4Z0T0_9ASTR